MWRPENSSVTLPQNEICVGPQHLLECGKEAQPGLFRPFEFDLTRVKLLSTDRHYGASGQLANGHNHASLLLRENTYTRAKAGLNLSPSANEAAFAEGLIVGDLNIQGTQCQRSRPD
jgi:hypothetical protein